MHKKDLHVHFNGAIPTHIVRKILMDNEIVLPDWFNIESDLQILEPAKDLRDYFRPWAAFKSIPIGYQMLDEMMYSTLKMLSEDNITYVEFRNSPFYISKLNNIPLKESIEWLLNSMNAHSHTFGIDARILFSITRHEYDEGECNGLLKTLKKIDSTRIVGVDLSGDENSPVDKKVSNFFRSAKEDLGLGVAIHAGETGNFQNIEWAIKECNADRIGHGISAIQSPQILHLIKEKDVCLEVSIISNLRTNAVCNIKAHPIFSLIEKNIPITLCSDNPAVHNTTLSQEYEHLLSLTNQDVVTKIMENANYYTFSRE